MSFSNSLIIKGKDGIYACGYNHENELILEFSNELNENIYGEDQNILTKLNLIEDSIYSFFPEIEQSINEYQKCAVDFMTEDEFNELKKNYEEETGETIDMNYSDYLSDYNKYIYYKENGDTIVNNLIFDKIYKVVSFRNVTFIIFNSPITLYGIYDDAVYGVNVYRTDETIQKLSNVLVYGNGSDGQLGNSLTCSLNKDKPIGYYFDSLVKDIKTGYYHSLFLTELGKIYVSGKNNKGQLGVTVENSDFQDTINSESTNNTLYVVYPKPVNDLPLIKKICCGSVASYLIDINNNLWVCGDNVKGELGLGDTKNRFKFVKIDYLKNVVDISAGDGFAIAVDIYGDVYVTGYNGLYQLGLSDKLDRNKFTKIDYLNEQIKRVYCDIDYSVLLTNNNKLLCCGNGTYNQFGSDTNLKKYIKNFTEITEIQDVKDVYTMQTSMVVLKQNNNVFGAGQNSYGELGIGTNTATNSFTKLNLYNPYAFSFDDAPISYSENVFTQYYNI